MITFSMVEIDNITSSVPRSNFTEADLEILADTILEAGGILKPLVLKKTGFEKYEVIDGHFEYFAAVRAKEKNSAKGEIVNCLIITPEKEKEVLQQIEVLAKSDVTKNLPKTTTDTTNLESRLLNTELRFEKQINELKAEQAKDRQRLEDELRNIKNLIPKQITPLEVFNSLSLAELTLRLTSAGLHKTAAQIAEIVEKERNKKKFESLSEVVERVKIRNGKKEVKGISSDKMISIIDIWSRTSFK